MVSWFERPRCPELLTGVNCSLTWREALEPAASVITYVTLGMYAMFFLFAFVMFADSWRGRKCGAILRGKDVRVLTTWSNFWACLSICLYYSVYWNLEYQLDDRKGKFAVFVFVVANGATIQTVNFVIVLFVSSLNNQLREDVDFLEKMDITILKAIAVPWDIWIVAIIIGLLLILNKISSIVLVIRVVYGAAVVLDTEKRVQYENLAKYSKRMAVFCIVFGVPSFVLILFAIFTNMLYHHVIYFAFQGSLGIGTSYFFILVILLLRRQASQNTSSKREGALFGCINRVTRKNSEGSVLVNSNEQVTDSKSGSSTK